MKMARAILVVTSTYVGVIYDVNRGEFLTWLCVLQLVVFASSRINGSLCASIGVSNETTGEEVQREPSLENPYR